MLLLSIFLPMLGAAALWLWKPQNRNARHLFVMAVTLLTSILVCAKVAATAQRAVTSRGTATVLPSTRSVCVHSSGVNSVMELVRPQYWMQNLM